ncbi:copper amine oxidase N-terminal domain-containing protein [Anaerotignum sp. MSJ-24]|uniref:copper amine oxidase N-terminal domain-containing protein n=1 Tax=Anaerotignum sp. MSJ-24 TaxID=2841521 RepID=UPI001C1278D8|nr:copper amine oxidase N-terminal domain-containing protein [Anaerotignum sp. MSJ-24]MBU5464458.1 copper amine oxidase N-terminal domain-containing protein [Anaerotignum sp. MSJ-24]
MKYKIASFLAAFMLLSSFTTNAFAADVLIDSRNVEADNILITEAEEGMFKKNSHLILSVDRIELEGDIKLNVIQGDIEAEAEITNKAGLKRATDVSDEDLKKYSDKCSYIVITIIDESTEPSVMEISGLKMYLNRTLPNGEYKLESVYTGNGETLWQNSSDNKEDYDKNGVFEYEPVIVSNDYVNVVTSGRDNDDSTVVKEIKIGVGEEKIKSGMNLIALDAPAYINEEGYTMLPLRAVSEALDANVSWNDATKSITVMRGQRVVSFSVGSRNMYINGTVVPMNTSVEIKDGRAFIPVRDIANALSISKIDWNEETKTVTLN